MKEIPTDERGGLASASKMDRIYNCAGSPIIDPPRPAKEEKEDEEDEVESSEIAVRESGTRIHDALRDQDFTGMDPEDERVALKLNEMGTEELHKWLWHLDPNAGPPEKRTQPTAVREHRIWIRRRDTLKPVASAQLDSYYIAGDDALVIDTKSGFLRSTHATQNVQLRIQAIAMKQEHPHLKRIRVAINQFRLSKYRTHSDYNESDLKFAEDEMMFRIWMAEQPDAPRTPGSWCLYCPINHDCIQAQVFAMTPSAMLPANVELTIEERVAKLSPLDRLHVWKQSGVIKKILKAINESLKAMPKPELEVLGVYVTEPQNIRSVSNIIDAYAILDKAGFLQGNDAEKAKQFSGYCKMPLGAIEKALTEHYAEKDGGTKKAAKEKAVSLMLPLITTTPKAGFLKEL